MTLKAYELLDDVHGAVHDRKVTRWILHRAS
jgi:hypothetical protein